MGYNTTFDLKWEGEPEAEDDVDERIIAFLKADNSPGRHRFDYLHSILVYEDTNQKWYEHDTDMIEFSKHFPKLTFTLTGAGEEHDDLWVAYYQNGEGWSGNATINYPTLDVLKARAALEKGKEND